MERAAQPRRVRRPRRQHRLRIQPARGGRRQHRQSGRRRRGRGDPEGLAPPVGVGGRPARALRRPRLTTRGPRRLGLQAQAVRQRGLSTRRDALPRRDGLVVPRQRPAHRDAPKVRRLTKRLRGVPPDAHRPRVPGWQGRDRPNRADPSGRFGQGGRVPEAPRARRRRVVQVRRDPDRRARA